MLSSSSGETPNSPQSSTPKKRTRSSPSSPNSSSQNQSAEVIQRINRPVSILWGHVLLVLVLLILSGDFLRKLPSIEQINKSDTFVLQKTEYDRIDAKWKGKKRPSTNERKGPSLTRVQKVEVAEHKLEIEKKQEIDREREEVRDQEMLKCDSNYLSISVLRTTEELCNQYLAVMMIPTFVLFSYWNWLSKEYVRVEAPKLYDDQCVKTVSCGRDRLTRQSIMTTRYVANPKVAFTHSIEKDEIQEEDKPIPPKEESEEAPADDDAPAEEVESVEPPPLVPERWTRCEVKMPVSKIAPIGTPLEDATGGLYIRATGPALSSLEEGEEMIEVTLDVEASIYSENFADIDFKDWCKQLATNLKNFSEKMLYLAPSVTKITDLKFRRAILEKARKFKFVSLKLSRSPSALQLLNKGEIKGSLGFFRDTPAKSPIPVGLKTRPKSSLN